MHTNSSEKRNKTKCTPEIEYKERCKNETYI